MAVTDLEQPKQSNCGIKDMCEVVEIKAECAAEMRRSGEKEKAQARTHERQWRETKRIVRLRSLGDRLSQDLGQTYACGGEGEEECGAQTENREGVEQGEARACSEKKDEVQMEKDDVADFFEESLGLFGHTSVAHGRDGDHLLYALPSTLNTTSTLLHGDVIHLALSADNNKDLFAHYIWNSGLVLSELLAARNIDCNGARILELGAGAGLPSLLALLMGAKEVVASDYPEREVIATLELNVEQNVPKDMKKKIAVVPHVWGDDVTNLLSAARPTESGASGFDVVLLADCLWLHYQHERLLATINSSLRQAGVAHVLFCNHTGGGEWQGFFDKAEDLYHFCVESVTTYKIEGAWGEQYALDEYSDEKRTVRHFTLRHS